MATMKKLFHQEKIGIALTEEEFEDLHSCVQEVASRMETSADKQWGGLFIKKKVITLRKLAEELMSIRNQQGVQNVEDVEYKGLPKENCETCE
jgi:hypothetical protein